MQTLKVPLIDISPLISKSQGNVDLISSVIQEISLACQNWGFFYVINHNIKESVISSVESESLNFFKLPKEIKSTVARFDGNFQGYSDTELTKQKLDWKQIFDFSPEDAFQSEVTSPLKGIGIHGKNQWPNDAILPNFKNTMTSYLKEVRNLGLVLMQAIFKGLEMDCSQIVDTQDLLEYCFSIKEDTSFGRLNYYPEYVSNGNNSNQLGVGPHSDAGVLTVLYQQEGVCSLQVLKDNTFYDIPPIKDSFVINIGDMTQVWSNGRYKAPIHRVLTNANKTRISIPFFLNPKYSCLVEPLCPREDQIYRPILWSEFRKGRVLGDYADLGEELQISHYLVK
ncbi:probable 2-oxoglutarate-dependent dioxygenase At5g05600 [Folsomia candida]|uniref:Putative 2-oxoglutarate/Fe(II)-dependent dioxygenase n=1 Tax=Folsomia candida TaxID=158441 RepID=A0A226EJA6_FOLCA|nr:probable 2-oxoglutarate-dependent dioxygenase At5g05600 [Folsomia candida]OXA57803.1 putative 2-oxoglutarate/Fe(II)-dependent dioxygenase [Folsomia candida]